MMLFLTAALRFVQSCQVSLTVSSCGMDSVLCLPQGTLPHSVGSLPPSSLSIVGLGTWQETLSRPGVLLEVKI